MAKMTGGCQCGAVRYELTNPPRRASICHCRMCQRATGSYMAPLANVVMSDFVVTKGELAIYPSSPVAERGFCRACGSPLTFRYTELDDISVTIGSLDEPDIAVPTKQFGIESTSAHWHTLASLPGSTIEEDMPAEWAEKISTGRN
ncbi:MAG: GFA family protein [Aestuariivirgaceae bacterium]